jgi:hypothetical protein
MMKNVPNFISYLHEFSDFLLTLYLFFLCGKIILEVFWNGKIADTWGPPVSGYAATRRARTGWPGRHCRHARALKAPSRQRRTRVRAPLPATSSVLHPPLVGSSRRCPSSCCQLPHSFLPPLLTPLLPRAQVTAEPCRLSASKAGRLPRLLLRRVAVEPCHPSASEASRLPRPHLGSSARWARRTTGAFPRASCPLSFRGPESMSRHHYQGIHRCPAPPHCRPRSSTAACCARPRAARAPGREPASAVGRRSRGPRLALCKQAAPV